MHMCVENCKVSKHIICVHVCVCVCVCVCMYVCVCVLLPYLLIQPSCNQLIKTIEGSRCYEQYVGSVDRNGITTVDATL